MTTDNVTPCPCCNNSGDLKPPNQWPTVGQPAGMPLTAKIGELERRVDVLKSESNRLQMALAAAYETLHDKYVMAVLTGLCTNPMWDEDDFEKLAEVARLQADACMKAREA